MELIEPNIPFTESKKVDFAAVALANTAGDFELRRFVKEGKLDYTVLQARCKQYKDHIDFMLF